VSPWDTPLRARRDRIVALDIFEDLKKKICVFFLVFKLTSSSNPGMKKRPRNVSQSAYFTPAGGACMKLVSESLSSSSPISSFCDRYPFANNNVCGVWWLSSSLHEETLYIIYIITSSILDAFVS